MSRLVAPVLGSIMLIVASGTRADEKATATQQLDWEIEDVRREAVVCIPASAKSESTPVVFGFHGHGGTAERGPQKFGFEKLWPEAIVVYMQGLPTPGKYDPEGKRNGWQKNAGEQGDRDLKFFDAVLSSLKRDYKVDDKRIYAAGHSNGGGFTYLLWVERPKTFAALAPSAGGFRVPKTKPEAVPVLHVAGKNDTIVSFRNQERTIVRVKSNNGCQSDGEEWAKNCTIYASEKGAPVVTMIHAGTHAYPDEAPPLIVKFFKEQSRK